MWLWFALAHAGAADDLDAVVRPYRDALIVAAAAPDLDEGRLRNLPVLGEILMHERRDAERAMREALVADVPRAKGEKGKAVDAFLDALEGHDLHDGDKLAFTGLLGALGDALAAAPAGKARDALLARVSEDREAVATIEAGYRAEMQALLGRLEGTRGMALTRERWDGYLGSIRAGRSADAIFHEHAADLDGNVGATRGLEDNASEIYGTGLPDKALVLTFDDGPDPAHTAAILDLLKARNLRAMFFQVGENVGAVDAEGKVTEDPVAAALTRRIVAEGHLLGNHSWSHANLPTVSDAELALQLDRSDDVLDTVSGVDVGYFRPPYGARDARVLREINSRSERAYLWNVDSRDWADPIPESIAQTVYAQATKAGRGVLLFHDVHAQTVAALPLLLDRLTADGFRFVLFDGDQVLGERGAPSTAAPAASSLYADSWAVVIGIDQYRSWPKLAYAVNDAEGVRDALVGRYGFPADHVTTLLDGQATRQRILEVLGDELPRRVGPDDRVVVFYAGHGATRDLPGGGQRGYLVPVDADTEHLQGRSISMSELQDVQEALPAKHVFVVTDACYSGLALTRGASHAGDPRRYIAEVTKRKARQILTAGGADEQVADGGPDGHSIFTHTLLQGMDGAGDLDGDGFITASELGAFVAPRVSGLSHQTPAFGSLVGSQGGELVFALRADQQLLSDATGRADAGEVADARRLLAAENDELKAELERMRAEVARFQADRGAAPADPKADAARLHALGLERFREGRLAEAIEAIRRAAELDPADVEVVNNLGYLLQEVGQHADAVPWLEKAVALDPQRAVAWLNLGDSLAPVGRDPDAAEAYRRYLAMVPESPVRDRLEGWLASR